MKHQNYYYEHKIEKLTFDFEAAKNSIISFYENQITREREEHATERAADLDKYTEVIDTLNAKIVRLQKEADALTTVIRRLCNER